MRLSRTRSTASPIAGRVIVGAGLDLGVAWLPGRPRSVKIHSVIHSLEVTRPGGAIVRHGIGMRLLTAADVERQPWLLEEADPLSYLLYRQNGVLSFRQALRHLSRSAVRHRVASGQWQLPHRGVYVAHAGPIGEPQRLWIAVLAAGEGAVVAGRTALARLGLKGFASASLHILLPGRRRESDPPAGVVIHRTGSLAPHDVHPRTRPTCTSVARAVVDAASWARSDDEARTVIAMAFQQRLVTVEQVREVLDRLTRIRRRQRIRGWADDAAGGSHSLGELELLRLIRLAGLPEPTRQLVRVDASGCRRYVDLSFDDYRLHVEIDGAQHSDARQAWPDMQRQNLLFLADAQVDRLLRFPVWLVREQPEVVLAQLRAALIAAGWRP